MGEASLPTHATAHVVRQVDLQRTLTVEQALQLGESLGEDLREYIEGRYEHWTDDEGTHFVPLTKELDADLADEAQEAVLRALRNLDII